MWLTGKRTVLSPFTRNPRVKPLCSASGPSNLIDTGDRKNPGTQGHGITILQMEWGGLLGLPILYMDAQHDELHLLNPSAESSESQDLRIWP